MVLYSGEERARVKGLVERALVRHAEPSEAHCPSASPSSPFCSAAGCYDATADALGPAAPAAAEEELGLLRRVAP